MSEPSAPESSTGASDLKKTIDETKEAAVGEANAAHAQARAAVEDAKAETSRQGEAVKERAAVEISQTSQALRRAASELDDGSVQHQMFNQAADAVASVSDALSTRSIGDIVDDLATFGRRNPAALIGGALLAGLMVSRFVTASERNDVTVADGPTTVPPAATGPVPTAPGDVPSQPVRGPAHG